jgi:hypothetical protein
MVLQQFCVILRNYQLKFWNILNLLIKLMLNYKKSWIFCMIK